jgi:hypothetical protein
MTLILVIIGSLIIKQICNFSDRETISAIQENFYMQYFIGYSSFSNIRKRLRVAQINEINEKILQLNEVLPASNTREPQEESKNENGGQQGDHE